MLVSDILKVLNFNNEREFFNSLEKVKVLGYPLIIYPYRKSNIGSKNKYTYFKHIYGVTISDKKEIKKIKRKVEVN